MLGGMNYRNRRKKTRFSIYIRGRKTQQILILSRKSLVDTIINPVQTRLSENNAIDQIHQVDDANDTVAQIIA